MKQNYDAILFVSFGAPEKPDDVMPFLRNVVRGRGVPDERLLEVAENYQMFGGRSPLNEQNKELITALRKSLAEINLDLPIYWGNRNWHPFLSDAISEMKRDGVRRALAFVTSAYSSYSGCRQYRENIERAKQEAGAEEVCVEKVRVFYNHPLFVEVNAENLQKAVEQIPFERRANAEIAFTAHSLPLAMARNCDYEAQLRETCRLVAESVGRENWTLAFQSRSGAPHVPWLEPDINDHLRALKTKNATDVVVHPIGFLSDHQEVVFDLDTQATETAQNLKINLVRAVTPGVHPKFVEMIRELILERTSDAPKRFVGTRGAKEDFCPSDCCLFEHGRKP
jgi:protoporphyrin/coproporphyrin ferrochelatase